MTFSRRPRLPQQNRGRIAAGGASAPFTPMALSPVLWLRADMGITIGTGVSQWSDQSGNANHFTQANPALQPNFTASDADLLGQSAVVFTVASNELTCSSSITIAWLSIVAVYPAATFLNFSTLFAKGGAGGDYAFRGNSGAAEWRVADGIAGTRYRDGTPTDTALTTANAPHVYELVPGSPVTSSGWRTGTDPSTTTRIWNDSVAEVIACSSDPSGALKAQWRAYCQSRYGTP